MATNRFAVIAALVLSLFLLGCVSNFADQGAVGIAKNLPEVQAFLNSHPNSTIKTAYWNEAAVNASIAQIRAQCGNQFETGSYYRVEFESQDLSLVAWVNEKTQRVDCSVTINKNGVVITPSPTVTPSPTPVCPAPPACPTALPCPVITPPACPTPTPCPTIQPPVCPTPTPCPRLTTSAVSEIRLLEPPGAATPTPTPTPTPGCPVITPCPPIFTCPTPFPCPTFPPRVCPTPRPCPTFPPRICPTPPAPPTPPPKPTKPPK